MDTTPAKAVALKAYRFAATTVPHLVHDYPYLAHDYPHLVHDFKVG